MASNTAAAAWTAGPAQSDFCVHPQTVLVHHDKEMMSQTPRAEIKHALWQPAPGLLMKRVCVKMMLGVHDPTRFLAEMAEIKRLTDGVPGFIPIRAFTREPLSIVMDDITPNCDIRTYALSPKFGYAWKTVYSIMWQIAYAMDALHKRGMVHRGLNPTNVLLQPNNWILILNARPLMTAKESARTHVWYVAPEVVRANFDPTAMTPQSDVYSFGMILYEMAMRRRSFHYVMTKNNPVVYEVVFHKPIVLLDMYPVPPLLRTLCKKCIQEDPAARPTFQEVSQAMLHAYHTEGEWLGRYVI